METLPRIEAIGPDSAAGFCCDLLGLLGEMAIANAELAQDGVRDTSPATWYGIAAVATLVRHTLLTIEEEV